MEQTPGTAPKVTQTDIEAAITSAWYFTAHDGVTGAAGVLDGFNDGPLPDSLLLLTFCVLVLDNGFTAQGWSKCVSPENFDAQVGRDLARKDAIEKVWPLLGFRLADQLADARAKDAAILRSEG